MSITPIKCVQQEQNQQQQQKGANMPIAHSWYSFITFISVEHQPSE